MQSLQMRWPVPGHIGLSSATSASAPIASPRFRSACISEIFSSSGQPSSSMPSGFVDDLQRRCLRRLVKALRAGILVALVAEHAVVNLAQHLARASCAIGQREAVAAAQPRVGADHVLGQLGERPLHAPRDARFDVFRKAEDHPARGRRIVNSCGAPALQRLHLATATARLIRPCRSSRDRAARSRRARPPVRRRARRTAPINARTIASSSAVDVTGPPLSSGKARRRTKSTLKRNRSSSARVAAARPSCR